MLPQPAFSGLARTTHPIHPMAAPYSPDGCTLFVKLRNMLPDDDLQCAIDTRLATGYTVRI